MLILIRIIVAPVHVYFYLFHTWFLLWAAQDAYMHCPTMLWISDTCSYISECSYIYICLCICNISACSLVWSMYAYSYCHESEYILIIAMPFDPICIHICVLIWWLSCFLPCPWSQIYVYVYEWVYCHCF